MSRQMLDRKPTLANRRNQLMQKPSFSSIPGDNGANTKIIRRSNSSAKFVESVGETSAQCAAVVCCVPMGLANLMVFTTYKVPTGLCRMALRQKRRRKLIKNGLTQPRKQLTHCVSEPQIHPILCDDDEFFQDVEFSEDTEKAVDDMEKEMMEKFSKSGFWRSPTKGE